MLVNAPLAFQKKLVEGADKNTTHQAETDQAATAVSPESGHVRCKQECPLWAKSGLTRCNMIGAK